MTGGLEHVAALDDADAVADGEEDSELEPEPPEPACWTSCPLLQPYSLGL